MSVEELRAVIAGLHASAGALAALGAALSERVTGRALDPAVAARVDEALDALGVRAAVAGAAGPELGPLLAEIKTFALTNAELLAGPDRGPGWSPADARLMRAAGDASAGLPRALARSIAPHLDGLSRRLASPGAAFLDVGAGVAMLSIQMARAWPGLRVVGVEPWPPALALARENVLAANLGARVELREQAGEDLTDLEAFDLAWVPSLFVPPRAIGPVLGRVRRALRPGGWLLLPALRGHHPDRLALASTRLRVAWWGGSMLSPERAEAELRLAGFEPARTFAGAPSATTVMLAARAATQSAGPAPGSV